MSFESILEEARKIRTLMEAEPPKAAGKAPEDDDPFGDLASGGTPDAGGGTAPATPAPGGETAPEGGGETPPAETEPKTDPEEEKIKGQMEKQKQQASAEVTEETDDDETSSLDLQVDKYFVQYETNAQPDDSVAHDPSKQYSVDINTFTQKVMRLAMNYESLISIPEVIIRRAELYLTNNISPSAAAEFKSQLEQSGYVDRIEMQDKYGTIKAPAGAGAGEGDIGGSGSGGI